MNDKVLVEILVPASGEAFDVFLPLAVKLSDVIPLVSEALTSLSGGKFKATADSILCDRESGSIYNINMCVGELGIINGARLMLI